MRSLTCGTKQVLMLACGSSGWSCSFDVSFIRQRLQAHRHGGGPLALRKSTHLAESFERRVPTLDSLLSRHFPAVIRRGGPSSLSRMFCTTKLGERIRCSPVYTGLHQENLANLNWLVETACQGSERTTVDLASRCAGSRSFQSLRTLTKCLPQWIGAELSWKAWAEESPQGRCGFFRRRWSMRGELGCLGQPQ